MKADEPAFTSRTKVYGDEFSFLTGDDAGHVFLQFVVALRRDEALSAFNRKDDMKVNLGVGVGHARKMPLRTELESLFWLWFYKDAALEGLRKGPVRDVFGDMARQHR